MTEATLNVPDMSCGHCKAAIEKELNRLPGVEISSADIGRGIVEVSYDESRLGIEQLKSAIEEAGYRVAA